MYRRLASCLRKTLMLIGFLLTLADLTRPPGVDGAHKKKVVITTNQQAKSRMKI